MGLLSLIVAPPAYAQSSGTLTAVGLIDKLFLPGIPFNPNNEPLLSQAEYERRSQDSREGIAIGLGTALASFPLGASSAGFTYVTDRVTGQRSLKATSFGPTFVERALTNGRGVLNIGFSYQVASFDTLQGVDLKNTGFVTQSQLGTYSDGSGVGDLFRAELDVTSKIFVFSGSYGVSDRLDVGWAIPIASVSMHGKTLRDYNGGKDWDANLLAGSGVPIRTLYPNKTGTQVISDDTVNATGLGDVVMRGKFAFGEPSRQLGMISAELRLPTGDEQNLLGTGKTSLRVIGGATMAAPNGSVNVNGGYTVGGLTDEINFAVGSDVAVLSRKQLTLTFDLIAQNLRNTVTSVENLTSFNGVLSNPDAGYLPRQVVVQYGFWNRGSTTLARAAVGAKYNIAGNWLITASALFRLNDNGYQPKFAPFIGLERTWSGR